MDQRQSRLTNSKPDELDEFNPAGSEVGDHRQRLVVTALRKLLAETSLESQLRFLHAIKVRFTLTTTDKGMYHCRVFKQYKDDGQIVTCQEYQSGGKSPHAALLNAIADFFMSESCDYHDFINDDWPGKRDK